MPVIKLIAVWLPIALGVVMIGTGVVNFAGPSLARENFALWGYPVGFHRVAGSLGVVARFTSNDPGDGAGWSYSGAPFSCWSQSRP